MDNSKITDLALKAVIAATDEFIINDVAGGNLDAKVLASAIKTFVKTGLVAADISDFDTEVSNNTDVTANTAKVTNATHTGDVTGSTVLTIAAKAVDIAMLADGTDGELITWDALGVATTVPVGTANHVLTSNGAGATPTFQALGRLEKLDEHVASTTESSYTASFSPALDEADYETILIFISGDMTASLILEVIIDSITSASYFVDGNRVGAGASNPRQTNGGTEIGLGTVISNVQATVTIEGMQLTQAGGQYSVYSSGTETIEHGRWFVNSDIADTIAAIKVETSTSTWKAGTKIVMYGVLR